MFEHTFASDSELSQSEFLAHTTLLGDINSDRFVDIYDALTLAAAYGSTPSSPNWNPEADIDGSGKVDILDAIILANHYGQKV